LSYQIPCHTGCPPLVPSVTIILQRFAAEWATRLQPEAILAACGEVGDPAWRDRVLTPVTTIQLFLSQILHGDTAFRHLPHRSGLWFTAAAHCQAGAKLPRRLFALLLEHLGSVVQRSTLDEGRWHGHCIFFVDRSGRVVKKLEISLPAASTIQPAPSFRLAGCPLHHAYSTSMESGTNGGGRAYGLENIAGVQHRISGAGIAAAQRVPRDRKSHPAQADQGARAPQRWGAEDAG